MHPKFARLITEREFEPHLCLIWSANPSINWASPTVEAVLGYTYDTLRVRGLRSLIHPSDRRVLHNMFVKLRGPAGAADILRVHRKDGSFLPLRIDLFFRPPVGNCDIEAPA
jgi:PAS domain-containing protein